MKIVLLQSDTSNLLETLLHKELEETVEELEEMEVNKVLLKDDSLEYYNELNNYKYKLIDAINEYGVASFGGIRSN